MNRSLTSWLLTLVLIVVALVIFVTHAYADVDDYPTAIAGCHYASNTRGAPFVGDLKDTTQDTLIDPWGEDNRECVSFAAWRLFSRNGVTLPWYGGFAYQWGYHAGYIPDSTPAVGAIAWWSASATLKYGHVAWVEAVNGSTITVEEYNYPSASNNYQYGMWGERTISASSPSGYIHFKDISACNDIALVGDVNGDGKADAVLVNPATGNVWVALSTGNRFSPPVQWSANPALANATKYFLADVNGDHMADIVAFFASTGSWYVGTSSGGGFWAPTSWATNEGGNSTNQFLADVNGDGKADVVLFWNNVSGMPQGTWAVDESSGSGFYGPPNQWITGAGVGSTSQVIGDFNGDGKADVGMYYASTGVWNISLSTGTSFGYPGSWSSGHGMGSNLQLDGDVNGDGLADIAYFWSSGSIAGTWEVGTSSGGGFWSPTYWATNEDAGSTTQFLANVTGGTEDAVVAYWANTPGQPAGMWTVDTSSGSGFYGPPNQWITGFGNNYQ